MSVRPNARPQTFTRHQGVTDSRAANLERNRVPDDSSFRGNHDQDPNPIDGQLYVYDLASGTMIPVSRQVTFQQPGNVTTFTASPPLDLEWSGIIKRLHVRLGTTGTSTTTVTLSVNGALITSVSLASGVATADSIATDTIVGTTGTFNPKSVTTSDRITLAVTAAGSGAKDLAGWVAL